MTHARPNNILVNLTNLNKSQKEIILKPGKYNTVVLKLTYGNHISKDSPTDMSFDLDKETTID